ncbi:MAG: hypothetical protein BWY28_00414 [bacterium ADurb.Bin236]|nr:MAG: hypothetical protein BWY28_00414 [bacterium ADurb.Bin236]
MPGYDRTGPMGSGPMTGKALGRCAGKAAEGSFAGTGRGGFPRGCGRGRAFGGGRGQGGSRFAQPASSAGEASFLKREAEALERVLRI